jgi:hypothetical protein
MVSFYCITYLTRKHLRLLALGSLAAVLLLYSGFAKADTYNVNATVPFPGPTQPANINPSLQGTTVRDALITIGGSCQLLNPVGVVTIWRNGASIGSSACDGTFSLQVMLQVGNNNLIARTANASGVYGPDSAPTNISLVLPPNLPVPTNPTPSPTSPASEIVSTNAGAASGLTAATDAPFSILNAANAVTIQVTIDGGVRPYDIMISWGDGTTEIKTVDVAGIYSFSHTYLTVDDYQIHGRVRDGLGAYAEFDHAVISHRAIPATNHALGGTDTGNKFSLWNNRWNKTVAASAGGIAVMGASYWYGWRRASQQVAKKLARPVRSRPKLRSHQMNKRVRR